VDTKWDRSPQCAPVVMRLLCTRLYQPKHSQQVDGNDYSFLFVVCKSTVSSFGPLVQEGYGQTEMSSTKATKLAGVWSTG